MDSGAVTRSIVQTAVWIMAARSGFIALAEGDTLLLKEWWDGRQWQELDVRYREGEGGPGHVWKMRATLTVEDTRNDPRLLTDNRLMLSHRTMVCCPIQTRYGEFLGVLELSDKNGGEPFIGEDARFLEGLCRHLAVALENARLYEEKRKSEEQRKQFYRDVICAATRNKLVLCDRWELHTPDRESDLYMTVGSPEDISGVRSSLARIVRDLLPDEERLDSLLLCVGEGATNAYKHGGGGDVTVWVEEKCIQVRITDQGPGIDATTLPKATLMPGFSTKMSLGMGLTIILDFVEQLSLSTDATGTLMDMYISREVEEEDLFAQFEASAFL